MAENENIKEDLIEEQAECETAEEVAAEETAAEETAAEETAQEPTELEKALAEKEEYLNALVRERADFENYKKRNAFTAAHAREDGKAEALTAMLPVADNLERAIAAAEDSAFKTGVEMVLRQFKDSMKSLGAEEMDALGKSFDPNLHNAVMQVEAEEGQEEGIVAEVLMTGYTLGDKVLRHAMVKVTN